MKWFVPQTDNLSLISAVHPVLSDGFAYSAMGKSIHKVDIESGEVIWKQTLDIPAFQGLSAFGMDSMIYDETIVFATSMTVVNALDKNDGHVLWSVDLADYGVLSVVNAAHFIYNDLFIYLGKNCVVKLDKETGVIYNILDLQQWIDDDGIQPGFAAVQQYEGVLYLPVAYNVNSTDLGAILCIDIESGALFWRKEFVPNDVTSLSSGRACAIQDSMLLLTTFKVIYGLDRFTGAIVWSDTLAGNTTYSIPMLRSEKGCSCLGQILEVLEPLM